MEASTIQEMMRGLFPETLGVRFETVEPGRVTATLEVREALCTTPGTLHGGVVMALADTVGAVGTVLNLPPGTTTTTLESKTNFLAAGRSGTTIRAEATPLRIGRRAMVWQTIVRGPDGKEIAVVTQTQMVLEPRREPAETMAAFFEGKSVAEQKALLASLERAGAGLYRAWAETEPDAAAREALLASAVREEENARALEHPEKT